MTRSMYFLGVTTRHSAIHALFPRWTALAGVAGAALAGIDIPLDAPCERYRAAIQTLLDDPDCCGALVTTHKVNAFHHARDLFTEFDADAARLGEVNCIVRRPGRLAGLATDTLTAGLALEDLLGRGDPPVATLIFGAGGAAVALATCIHRRWAEASVVLTDISAARLETVRPLIPARCERVTRPADHDRLLESMPSGSLIVNATGMGKDRPGAPITPQARFPQGALAWDFNYRGELVFLEIARRQSIRAVDGWNYFLHGWSQVMARVFGFQVTPDLFARMRAAASPRIDEA